MKLLTKYIFAILLLYSGMTNTIIAQDWANLNRYKKANKALLPVAENESRVVFMGNSITDSWGQFTPEFFEENPYINRGISGQTTPQMLLRLKADVIDIQATVVVILAGTNDIAGNTGPMTLEQIMTNLASMAELATAHGVKVVLCSVLPAFDYSWRPGLKPNIKIPKLNTMIQHYAQQKGLVYLDYFTPMATENNGMIEAYTYDGVHPNKAGYEFMAPLAKAAIQKTLNSSKLDLWKEEVAHMEALFNEMVARQGIAKAFLHFASKDAVLMRNDKIIKGDSALKNHFKNTPSERPNEKLVWKPDFIDVSASGDLAYTYGPYIYSYTNEKGEIVEHKGIFHTVWKRQSDGHWKYVWD